jgi:hypothetical protein
LKLSKLAQHPLFEWRVFPAKPRLHRVYRRMSGGGYRANGVSWWYGLRLRLSLLPAPEAIVSAGCTAGIAFRAKAAASRHSGDQGARGVRVLVIDAAEGQVPCF